MAPVMRRRLDNVKCLFIVLQQCNEILIVNEINRRPEKMKGRKWYSLKKDLRHFVTGTSQCSILY